MNRILRFYNKNKRTFWLVVVIAIIVISIPRMLNAIATKSKNTDEESSSIINNTTTYNKSKNEFVTGKIIEENTSKQNTTIIDNFINYCNNGNISEAYELISNDCKNALYPTNQDFIEKYYNKIFSSYKSYNLQAWNSNSAYTYKVDYIEDVLSTGKINTNAIEDYYTIVSENGEYKININRYIKTQDIGAEFENDSIDILAVSKDIYIDYEIYNFDVKKKETSSIMLDTLKGTNTMYLEDEGGLKYYSFAHELVTEDVTIRARKNVSIKFNKRYDTQKQIERIVFENVTLGNGEYFQVQIEV